LGEKAHLRTVAAVLANATATTLVYPSMQGLTPAHRPAPACGPARAGPHTSLSRKTSRTLYISQRYKKTVQRKFSTGDLGKGNSEKMCLQPAPEGAKCLTQ